MTGGGVGLNIDIKHDKVNVYTCRKLNQNDGENEKGAMLKKKSVFLLFGIWFAKIFNALECIFKRVFAKERTE